MWRSSAASALASLPPELLPSGQLPHQTALHLAAACPDRLEHLPHLHVLLEQLIHFLHRRSRTAGDTLAAAAGDDLVVIALLLGHRVDDRLDARKLPLVDLVGHLLDALKG